jgi:hypothetical protein
MRSAAHLRISPGQSGGGDIELHLRIRGGVAHLRVDGDGGHLVAKSAPELASALSSAGLSLGKLETPSPGPSAALEHSAKPDAQGDGGRRGGDFEFGREEQPRSSERGGGLVSPQQPSRTRSGPTPTAPGRIHVEA